MNRTLWVMLSHPFFEMWRLIREPLEATWTVQMR